MSKVSIYGSARPIKEIFSPNFVFSIPLFQRPYAWTKDQAGELLEDLRTFIDEGKKPLDELNPYFLGSIVLIKEEKSSHAQIIDGQQRITTLTILLAVIRKLLSSKKQYEKFTRSLTEYLYDEANPIDGTPNRYRLDLRHQDLNFFRENIQEEGGVDNLENLNPARLSDSQQRIRENALLFLDELSKLDETLLIYLVRAVANNCFLVEISTPDLDSAYSVFSVLNSRGLNLTLTDILKAEIIGRIPQYAQEAYNTRWEKVEDDLGRDLFQNLFTYIRTIYRKVKPKDTILKEIREYVRPAEHPQWFIEKVLEPYADAYYSIRMKAFVSMSNAEDVNRIFGWLNEIDNSDWIPPAILFYERNQQDVKAMLRFFTDLERLAAGLMIIRANVNKRIDRYGLLLSAIQKNVDLYADDSPLQLSKSEQQQIVSVLDGDLYWYGACKYVLLRLNEALSDGSVSFNYPIISIEHVLPQHPRTPSRWVDWFPTQDIRDKYAHRLGNLVLLSRKKNAQAQNFDFDDKLHKYFSSQIGIVAFPITIQVMNEHEWTPVVIERRQQEQINRLKKIWRLN